MVGQIVKLKQACLGNEPGTLGVCYEDYYIGHEGSSFIFENGNYVVFDLEEQKLFLENVAFSTEISGYRFMNVMKLSQDFNRGVFNSYLYKKS